MKKQTILTALLLTPIFLLAQIKVQNLTVEGRKNPLGLDIENPRLAWQIQSSKRDVVQTAYQILVASSPQILSKNKGDLYSSKIQNPKSEIKLPPSVFRWEKTFFWKIRVFTNKGVSDWSEIAHFSTGLEHWSKPKSTNLPISQSHNHPISKSPKWIGADSLFKNERPFDTFPKVPARYLRKEFSVDKKILRATAYIAVGGVYELYFNGQKIGDAVLAPAATDYSRRVFYNTFDVTAEIISKNDPSVKSGKNAIGVILGNGRYCSPRPHRVSAPPQPHFGMPKMLFQLTIEYENGERETVVSDESWRISNQGPIVSNNEFDGETYDETRQFSIDSTDEKRWGNFESFPNVNAANYWSSISYKENQTWQNVQLVAPAAPILQSQPNPLIRVVETIKPLKLTEPKPQTWVFDMGQNMVGWARLKVKRGRSRIFRLRFAENLNADGTLNFDNIRAAQVTDWFGSDGLFFGCFVEPDSVRLKMINSKSEFISWEPKFTYHGFRYVELTGLDEKPTLETIEGRVVADDVAQIGFFESSDSLLNRLFQNAKWGIRGNYHGFPTDCPQRDERQGWLGDRTVVGTSESFIFDNHLLYKKWMQDIADAQNTEGAIPDVAPKFWKVYSDNMTWPASFPFNLEMIYKQFGDEEPIRQHYESVKKWRDYMIKNYADTEGVISKDQYGDWSMPPEDIREVHPKDSTRRTPAAFLATSFLLKITQQLADFAKILDKKDEALKFENEAKSLITHINKRFFDQNKKQYANNTATANVLALAFDIAPKEHRKAIFQKVVDKIERDANGHQTTGLIGLQQLMRLLTTEGRPDLAMQLATDTVYPSWGYMVNRGATTYWEHWNGDKLGRRNSGNHVMMIGDLVIWLFENVAGIKATLPAFQTIEMQSSAMGKLSFVNSSYVSPFGKIVSNWKVKEGKFSWHIEIPANTKAKIKLPNGGKGQIFESNRPLSKKRILTDGTIEIGSGIYDFELQMDGKLP